jgi:hypothetical protein
MAADELGRLNASLFHLVDSFPRATWELVDYHFKSAYDDYLTVLQHAEGRKVAVFANNLPNLERLCRRLLLVADKIVFNVATYSAQPAVSIFPIPDSVSSPVLGVAPIIDPEGGRPRFPKPVEVVYMLTTTAAISSSREPDTVLGYEWGRESSAWQRSNFTRTSEPYLNDRGEACHIAVGLGYRYEDETYRWLSEQARELMISGSLAFVPFVRVTPEVGAADEALMKSGALGAAFATAGHEVHLQRGGLHLVTTLEVPYIDNIPLPLLSRVLADERDSLGVFRRAMDRAMEDIEATSDPTAVRSELKRIKRDLLEDELDRLEDTCRRITRMRTLSAAGAVVTTGAISLATAFGMAIPQVIMGAAGGLTVTLAGLWQTFEEKRQVRKSPMYWLWKLGRRAGAA